MAGEKDSGPGTGNTSQFRRTWDTQEYRIRARERELSLRDRSAPVTEDNAAPGANNNDGQIAGVGGYSLVTETLHNKVKKDINAKVNTVELISLNPSDPTSHAPGYHCSSCNLTLRDNLSYLDHLNSRRHLMAIGVVARMSRSTVQDVQNRLDAIRAQRKAKRHQRRQADQTLTDLANSADPEQSESLVNRIQSIQDEEKALKINKRKRYRENKRKRLGNSTDSD